MPTLCLYIILCAAVAFQSALCAFDGFYMGGSVGETVLTGTQNGNAIAPASFPAMPFPIVATSSQNLQTKLFARHGSAMLYEGLGYYKGPLYVAVEVFAHYSPNKTSATFQSNTTSRQGFNLNIFDNTRVKFGPWHYGADVRHGLLLGKHTLIYARVGVDRTRLEFKSESATFGNTTTSFNLPILRSQTKKSNFLRVGGGIEQHITPKLAWRTDYIYTNYRSRSVAGTNQVTIGTASFSFSESKKIHLHTHTFLVGLAYYFSCWNGCRPFSALASISPSKFCGWYAGVSGGGGFADSKNRGTLFNLSNSIRGETHSTQWTRHLTQGIGRGIIYGGYSLLPLSILRCPLFIALEAFAQCSPYSQIRTETQVFATGDGANAATNATTTQIRIHDWQCGGDFRFGMRVTPCSLIYGSIGVSSARLRMRTHAVFTNPFASLNVIESQHRRRSVARVGAGIEQAINKNWHYRLDYRYTDYRSLQVSGSAASTAPIIPIGNISLSVSNKVHPKDHAFTVGLCHYF